MTHACDLKVNRAAGRQGAVGRRQAPWELRGGWPAAGVWATAGGLVKARGWRVLDGKRLILIDLLFLLVIDWPIFCFRLPRMSASQLTDLCHPCAHPWADSQSKQRDRTEPRNCTKNLKKNTHVQKQTQAVCQNARDDERQGRKSLRFDPTVGSNRAPPGDSDPKMRETAKVRARHSWSNAHV